MKQPRQINENHGLKKTWVRFIFISLPLAVLFIQLFIPPPHQSGWPTGIRKAVRALAPPVEVALRYFDFNQKNALSSWENKIFQGQVAYWVDFEKGGGFVHSHSKKSASAIFHRIKFDVSKFPHLSWRWRVAKFPDKTKINDLKKRDDFAARLYVVFLSGFFSNFRCVEYVWDESLPEGTILESPYTEKIKQVVVQAGPSPSKDWVLESQNVLEDYKKLFGEEPKMKVAAIALMTDSEGTEGEAEAFFDDIQIGKNK